MWVDTHCHLDAPEFEPDRDAVAQSARLAGVAMVVLPAVAVSNFDAVRELAHRHGWAYALGIHPMCVDAADDGDLERLQDALRRHRDDPRLVAVGEIGLDFFVPGLGRERQERFYAAQLGLARAAGLPVLLHVRRSVDLVLKGLRRTEVPGGIAHAFNGSLVQAQQFVARGFRLGFGGASTFDTARQIRHVAVQVADEAPVMETDAPDIPPHWLYRTAGERRDEGGGQARNEPAELPRIGAAFGALRGWSADETAERTRANAHAALPRLVALTADAPGTGPAPGSDPESGPSSGPESAQAAHPGIIGG